MATKKKEEESVVVQIVRPEYVTSKIRIVGDTELITHAWSEKAKKEILDKEMGIKNTGKKANKNPVEDFINSFYWLSEKPTEYTMEAFDKAIANGARFGFPITAVKQCAINGAYQMQWVKYKTEVRPHFFLKPDQDEFVEVHYKQPPVIREDMVRVSNGNADIRYRGAFKDWYMDLNIVWNKTGRVSFDNIVNFINIGGFNNGIGEWRNEKDGLFGMYHVELTENK